MYVLRHAIMYICMQACTYVYMYVCHACMYAHVYVYVRWYKKIVHVVDVPPPSPAAVLVLRSPLLPLRGWLLLP